MNLDDYSKGTKYLPKTGIAKLHEGERVIKASDNKKLGGMSNMRLVEAALAHKKQEAKEPAKEEKTETPAKELKELRIRRTANNGAIVEHHYVAPEHKMEEHTVSNKKQLAKHLMQHMDGMDEGNEAPDKSDVAEYEDGTEFVQPAIDTSAIREQQAQEQEALDKELAQKWADSEKQAEEQAKQQTAKKSGGIGGIIGK